MKRKEEERKREEDGEGRGTHGIDSRAGAREWV